MKQFNRLALPLLAALSLTACGESPKTMFEKAQKDFAADEFQSARVQLVKALKEQPDNQEMISLLVETQIRLNDPDGAERSLARYEKMVGNSPEFNRLKAQVVLLRGDPKQTLALVKGDLTPDAWRIRAEAYLALGDKKNAVDAFNQGIKSGNNVRLSISYGRYLLLNGKYLEAEKILAQLRKIAPNSYEALIMAGDLAVAQGHNRQSIPYYRKALEGYPDRVEPMLALAGQYDQIGQVDDAQKLINQAIEVAPNNPLVQELHIQILAEKGEWERIRQLLQTHESELPAGSALSMTYGEAMLRLGHPEQARMIFRRASLAYPSNPYARLMLGKAQLATGDNQGAWHSLAPLANATLATAEILEPALQAARAVKAPEVADLQARLDPKKLKESNELGDQAQAYFQKQEWAKSAVIYEKLLSRRSDPEILKQLALVKSEMGDDASAIRYADRAVELVRDNPDYLFVSGIVRIRAKRDLGEAQRLLEMAAGIDPRNQSIAAALKNMKAAAS